MIYIIQAGISGPIKVGYTRDDKSLQMRIRSLQTSSPEPLELRFSGEGDRGQEQHVHAVLQADGMLGEWFKPSPIVLQFIIITKEKGIAGAIADMNEIKQMNDIVRAIEQRETTSRFRNRSHGPKARRSPNRLFTDVLIEGLETRGVNYRIYESGPSPGFGIQVTVRGTKIFFSQYTIKSKRRFLTIGTYPYTTLPEARRLWLESRKLLEQGIDPQESYAQDELESLNYTVDRRGDYQLVAEAKAG